MRALVSVLALLLTGCGTVQAVKDASHSVVEILQHAAEAPDALHDPTSQTRGEIEQGSALSRLEDDAAIVTRGAAVVIDVARFVGAVRKRFTKPAVTVPVPLVVAVTDPTVQAPAMPPAEPPGWPWGKIAGWGAVGAGAVVLWIVRRRRGIS